MLTRDTAESELETCHENCCTQLGKMDEEKQPCGIWAYVHNNGEQSIARPKEKWEDDIKDFIKIGETEESRGSDG